MRATGIEHKSVNKQVKVIVWSVQVIQGLNILCCRIKLASLSVYYKIRFPVTKSKVLPSRCHSHVGPGGTFQRQK